MVDLLLRMAGAISDALFPRTCLGCAGIFLRPEIPDAYRPQAHLEMNEIKALFALTMVPHACESCREAFSPRRSPCCPQCGEPFASTEGEDHLCRQCISNPPAFLSADWVGKYDGTLMAAIHAFKYKYNVGLARPLGQLLYALYSRIAAERTIDCIVPVPLHPKRLRERGFNQAALLLHQWEKFVRRQQISAPGFRIDGHSLVRTRRTQPQTGLGREQRYRNIRGAFKLNPSHGVKGKRLLLVDDVYTTGATLNECAETLLKGGAREVRVLTLARAWSK